MFFSSTWLRLALGFRFGGLNGTRSRDGATPRRPGGLETASMSLSCDKGPVSQHIYFD